MDLNKSNNGKTYNGLLPSKKLPSSLARKASENSFSNSLLNGTLNGIGNLSLNQSATSKTPKQRVKTPSAGGKSGGPGSSKSKQSSKCKTPGGDRFIADRSNFEMAGYLLKQQQQPKTTNPDAAIPSSSASSDNDSTTGEIKCNTSVYSKSLTETILGVSDLAAPRVLSFTQKPKGAPEGYQNALKVVYQGAVSGSSSSISKYRVLPKSPERVLDAPDVVDDYYLNVMDWSKTNVLAIALKDQVYLWTAHNAEITRIPCDIQTGVSVVSSVSWVRDGSHVLCGTNTGTIQVWDIERVKIVRTLRSPDSTSRIAAMSTWGHVVVQGNRAGNLRHHDLRASDHNILTLNNAHSQEICGVKWSPDGRFYATGGNDNVLNIWDSSAAGTHQPVCAFTQHLAAIKALCWSPTHSNLLASGGGTNDRSIKLWNVSSGSLLRSIDADSQVSGLVWSEAYREIISSHGYSKNHLAIWKYSDMTKVGEIVGHTHRILSMVASPDDTTVATVSGDETLRFWRVFPPTKSNNEKAKTQKSNNNLVLNGLLR